MSRPVALIVLVLFGFSVPAIAQQNLLWLGDDMEGDVFQTDTSGRVLRQLANLPVSGIAWNGQFLYFSDDAGTITRRNPDGTSVLERFSVPQAAGEPAEDMAWDPVRQRLWRADKPQWLLRIDPAAHRAERTFQLTLPFANCKGRGVAYDSRRDVLYYGCGEGDKEGENPRGAVLEVNPDTGRVQRQVFPTSHLVAGLAYDPATDTLWLGTQTEIVHVSLTGGRIGGFSRPQPTGDIADGLEFIGGSCVGSISPTVQTYSAGGGTGSVSVTAPGDCNWTVSAPPWITINSSSGGSGNGSVAYSVASNPGPTRSGTVSIGGLPFTVIQADPESSCTYSLSEVGGNFPAAGGTKTVNVSTSPGCYWAASSDSEWIILREPANGIGSGSFEYIVATNTAGSRTGSITVSGQFRVGGAVSAGLQAMVEGSIRVLLTSPINQLQSDPGCTFAVSPNAVTVPRAAGSTIISVITTGLCHWTYGAPPDWIQLSRPQEGLDRLVVNFPTNPGPRRSATITVAGQTVTVRQAGACDSSLYSLSPTYDVVGFAQGHESVGITAPDDCAWQATTGADWISVDSSNHEGSETITYSFEENNADDERTGYFYVAGHSFIVHQSRPDIGPVEAFVRNCILYFFHGGPLQSERRFRDEVMSQTPRGREYTRLYYQVSGEAVTLLLLHPSLLWQGREVLERSKPLMDSILAGEKPALSPVDVEEIDGFLNEFESKATGNLRQVIRSARRDLRDPAAQSDFGVRVVPNASPKLERKER